MEIDIMRSAVKNQYPLTGRKRLVTTVDGVDINAVVADIGKQSAARHYSQLSAKWLWDYARNNQPILDRVDDSDGASSNNKVVVNFAAAIARNLSAYTFPKGINYLSRNDSTECREFVEKLNKMMSLKSNNVAAQEMKWYQSVCGHAFLYVNRDNSKLHDIPFMVQNIEPWNAFVVYSAYNVYEPVYAVVEYEDNSKVVFTKDVFVLIDENNAASKPTPHILGEVPIIEVPNNTMRMGDFELALSLLDAINSVTSDSVNNVQDIVKAYLVLIGVDKLDVEDEKGNPRMDFTKGSIITLSGQQGVNQSAQFIAPQLDGTSVQQLRSYMDSALKFITGIPDRDTDNAASSTGVSEDIKTGQSDKDAIANEKTIFVEQSQRRILEIIFRILQLEEPQLIPDGMTAADIDVDITRANRDNILTKTQAMLNLKQIGMCDEDVVYFGNITNDVAGVASRMVAEQASESEDDLNAELEMLRNRSTRDIKEGV
ncbi:MAG: phage portal protein [Lachnospiraceae bacterium]|nr:phage portal protein [Lachnospiraceae bacterium]